MLRLIGLVVSIGIADSVNPTTIGPALYLSTSEGARMKVIEFTGAVFAVYLLGGRCDRARARSAAVVVGASSGPPSQL